VSQAVKACKVRTLLRYIHKCGVMIYEEEFN
jgi:hypothetical protein